MIITNLSCNHIFCDVVAGLVARDGGKEISTQYIVAPKNVTYVSRIYL